MHIGRVGSAFATVTVTVERFIAVMYPLKKLRNTRILLSVPIIGSLFSNIPRFFEFKTSLVYFDGQHYFRFSNDTNSTNLTTVSRLFLQSYICIIIMLLRPIFDDILFTLHFGRCIPYMLGEAEYSNWNKRIFL